tara:strand:- start:441 stop:731 length:291 start_codon:yes stop_codon:yes gene_type:complete
MMAKRFNLLTWLVTCHFGNIVDTLCTLYAVSKGVKELNPLMAWLISFSPALFVTVKLLIFAFAVDVLARRRPIWLPAVAILYLSVVVWHLSFIFHI